MPLPLIDDEAGLRAVDAKSASPGSADAKRTVMLLASLPRQLKEYYLYSAVYWSLPSLTRCCLEAKCSADTRDEDGDPILVMAAGNGDVRVIKVLLDGGAHHGLQNRYGFTAICGAAEGGHLEAVRLLLAAGADANLGSVFGTTPLMKAISQKHTECARALLPVSDLLRTNIQGFQPIHVCILTGNEECFELLLPLIGDVDVRTLPGVDEHGKAKITFNTTPLHLACQAGLQPMVKALLQRGASRMARDNEQTTPLHFAADAGHLSCVILLIGRKGREKMTPAEVSAVDTDGISALHAAAHHGFEKIVGVLLQAGARLDLKDVLGDTPLMLARKAHPTNTPLLALLSGAAPAHLPGTVCDHCGKSAEQAGVEFLKSCGACYGMRYCGAGCSAAAWPGHKEACKEARAERERRTTTRTVAAPPLQAPRQ